MAQGISGMSCEVFHWCVGSIVMTYRFSCVPCGRWDLTTVTRDQIQVSWNARCIPDHWTTREVPRHSFSINCYKRNISYISVVLDTRSLGRQMVSVGVRSFLAYTVPPGVTVVKTMC